LARGQWRGSEGNVAAKRLGNLKEVRMMKAAVEARPDFARLFDFVKQFHRLCYCKLTVL
jgi:hypothetical protein